MRDAAIGAVLDALAARMNWSAPFDRGSGTVRRGRGVAIGFKASISPTTSVAIVTVAADGSIALAMNTVDMGQGADTAMALIVAEVLGIAAEEVRVILPDTDVAPYDMGTLGSRSTFHMGHAVRLAATDARARLAALGPKPACRRAPIIRRRRFSANATACRPATSSAPAPTSRATRRPMRAGLSADVTPFWMVGAAGAEVEVDTETGHVRVTRLVNVADAGTPLNPAVAHAQLSGAAIMQLGFTLQEKMEFDGGQVTNASLADYKIPGIHDVPPMEGELVRSEQTQRPVRRQGARRIRHLRRLARDRERDPRRGRRAAHRVADEAGSRAARDPRRAGPAAGGGVSIVLPKKRLDEET